MGQFALISDIHSNIEALAAVLQDIERRGIKTIFCLGDIVGYGASPLECLDLVAERTEGCLCGNHDMAVFYEPTNFNISAERACYWTRHLLEEETNKPKRDRRWEFLGRLPAKLVYHDMLLVHGSPRRPVNEYLFAEDVYTNPHKILANFERLDNHIRACFVGHTHVPGVFLDDPYFDPPSELSEGGKYLIADDEKAIINVGSVGQPRDRDVRASYVMVTEDDGGNWEEFVKSSGNGTYPKTTAEFVRVEYDVEKAVGRVLAVPELDDFLGARLWEGR
jgi:diadenosine tetraphosphatase ApaH/serine/threonine PP2A family protein phosphatase